MHPTLSFPKPPFLPLPNEVKKTPFTMLTMLVNLLAAAVEV